MSQTPTDPSDAAATTTPASIAPGSTPGSLEPASTAAPTTSATAVSQVAAAAAAPAPPALAANADWLTTLNFYRASAGLAPVRHDPELSRRSALHARYVVKANEFGHAENPASPFYTKDGHDAAQKGLVGAGRELHSDRSEIEGWMRAPFHAIRIVDPTITAVGYGRFDDRGAKGFRHASVLYIKRPPIHYLDGVRTPVAPAIWPSRHSAVPLSRFFGIEFPDPIAYCPGYTFTAGLPIVANAGDDVTVKSVELTEDDAPIAFCAIHRGTYESARTDDLQSTRNLLGRHGIIVMPQSALSPGRRYRVRIVTSGPTFDETFSVRPSVPAALPGWSAFVDASSARVVWSVPDDGGSPITRYLVDVPNGQRMAVPGDASAVELASLVPVGKSHIVISAENAAGIGDPVTVEMDIAPGMAGTPLPSAPARTPTPDIGPKRNGAVVRIPATKALPQKAPATTKPTKTTKTTKTTARR